MPTYLLSQQSLPREGYISLENAGLYYREIGKGQPIILLHGGPDFDHNYFLPDMDRLADSFRLIYYAQRGRGKSAGNVQPEEVSIRSEMEDLECVRANFQLNSVILLGHSWGGLLAMEYAIRHPGRVSHLILMNTAPASHADYLLFRQKRRGRAAADLEKLKHLRETIKYQEGDLETDAQYYRIHFGETLRQTDQLEGLVKSLRWNFTPQTIVKARAIEERLYKETWLLPEYNLIPSLNELHIPTLVIHGDNDLIPSECAAHIAEAIPGARFVSIKACGHFAYIERPTEVHKEIDEFSSTSFEFHLNQKRRQPWLPPFVDYRYCNNK